MSQEKKILTNIEDSIMSWYIDFQNLHDLREEYCEYTWNLELDYDSDLLNKIGSIVSEDLHGHHKKDELLHYIMGDLDRHLDWKRICEFLYSEYFG